MMKLSLLLLVLGVACFVAFKFSGSTLDAAGIVHEPFLLVITGWSLIVFGIIAGIISGLYRGGVKIFKAFR